MSFSFWGQWGNPSIWFDLQPAGYVLLFLYVVLLLWTCYSERHHLIRLSAWNVLVWLSCIALALILGNVLTVGWHSASPYILDGASSPYLALLMGVPVVLASSVGVFPAALTGLAVGLMRGVWVSHDILPAFEVVLWGIVAARMIRQDYRGLVPRVLRLPLVASLFGAIAMWASGVLSCTAFGAGVSLFPLSLCSKARAADLQFALLAGAVAGIAVHILFALIPRLVPTSLGTRSLPKRTIRAQVLTAFVPAALIAVLLVLYVVTSTVVGAAVQRSIAEVRRDAAVAGQRTRYVVRTGHERLSKTSADTLLLTAPGNLSSEDLDHPDTMSGFFRQVIHLDQSGSVVAAYPPLDSGSTLSSREIELSTEVIESGAPRVSEVHRLNDSSVVLSLLDPVIQPSGDVSGVMIGRLDMQWSPAMRDLIDALQLTMGHGQGFIVDGRGLIMAHPDRSLTLTAWEPGPRPGTILWSEPGGAAYVETTAQGATFLTYYGAIPGTTWAIVISIPYETVLESVREIVTPIAVLLVCIALAAGGFLYWRTVRLARRLDALSLATANMAQGHLDSPVAVSGNDEVSRVGSAIESMRVGLRTRLKDFSLLLHISRAVSANLSLEQNLQPVLTGAVTATQALSARVILMSSDGRPQREVRFQRSGDMKWQQADAFSEPLLRIVRNKRGIKVRNAAAYPAVFSPDTAMALAFPLLAEDRLIGVFVAEYGPRTDFAVSEIEFLGTLAGQAAVAVQSARLFEAVASEKRRLAAILASASDGIIVTDSSNRLIMANPAAQQCLGFRPREASSRFVAELSSERELVEFLAGSPADPAVSVREITLSDGRTLYASASPIVESNGDFLGRVVVMRDITDQKEIAAMKSEFVDTVSHDLRAPLTVIKGYATLAETSGPVTDKQKVALQKIRLSVAQMTELIDNLLDLGRIEAGIDVTMSRCQLGTLIRDVALRFRAQAEAKGLTLTVRLPLDLPPVAGDPLLLGQAIANLVDNAIKYTPAGFVHISAGLAPNEVIIGVRDSGIGITPADQPRLFEKFYRVRNRNTIKIRGTGLGLSIVKSIAELHGGRIWVESVPDKGSSFYLSLPATSATSGEGNQ